VEEEIGVIFPTVKRPVDEGMLARLQRNEKKSNLQQIVARLVGGKSLL